MAVFLIDNFDAIPKKNIIKALSSDTDKYTPILELIDNSYTSWLQKELSNPLNIIMEIDNEDRILKYIDNSGGMNIDKRRQVNNRNMGLPLKNRIEIANIGGKEV